LLRITSAYKINIRPNVYSVKGNAMPHLVSFTFPIWDISLFCGWASSNPSGKDLFRRKGAGDSVEDEVHKAQDILDIVLPVFAQKSGKL
jgi:hypothetical protein